MTTKNNSGIILWIFILSALVSSLFAAQPPARKLFFQDPSSIWLGTKEGLCRYQIENELWSAVKSETATDICIDENNIWLGTANRLFCADMRYLDWKVYSKETGLPSDSIVRVAADLDYIYAATSGGLVRMDKLVEQWEPIGDFTDKKIYDLYSDKNYLWAATDKGLFYFEKQYEKWKGYTVDNGLISNTIFQIFYFNEYIWVLTDKGFSRYSTAMQTWNSYALNRDITATEITDFWFDAEYIWIASPEGVFRFGAKNQSWENFSINTPIMTVPVRSIATSGKNAWFATDNGVYSFNSETRRWVTYTAIEGLNDDVQDAIYCVGQTVVAKKANDFNVYFPSEDLWHTKQLALSAATGEQKSRGEFFNDERGLGFATPSQKSASLLGRAYFKVKNKAEFPAPVIESIKDYITSNNLDSIVYDTLDTIITATDTIPRFKDYLYWWPKAQLNMNVDLKKERTIRGTFDNTDPMGDLKYGLEYRGYGDNRLRSLGVLKNQKTDYFFSSLIDPTYMEGANLRAEFGDRIGEKKRRRVNTGLWAGWRKTDYLRKLIPFQEDNFYYLNVNNIVTETVELRVDGKIVDPREYSIERTVGLLTFKNEGLVNPDSYIEITLEYEPELGGHTSDMAAAENMLVFSDNISAGVNGVYRGYREPDRPGTGVDTNRLFTGSVNGKIEYKSKNDKFSFRAIPEVAGSYNDSIVVAKQGTGAKLDANTVINNFKLRGKGQYFTPDFETVSDVSSIYGRIDNQAEGEAVYEFLPYMPLTVGASMLNANLGNENTQHLEYLAAPAGLPSFKFRALRQSSNTLSLRDPRFHPDSLKRERYNGRVEVEWDLPENVLKTLHINKLWFNASYTLNFTADSSDTNQNATFSDATYMQNLNHNIFGWFRILPHKKITLETKQIIRLFQQRENTEDPFAKAVQRYRPEFTLFSQEFIPGVTLYSKLLWEESEYLPVQQDQDTATAMSKIRLNSSMLLVPGVWWDILNPLQVNLSYNLATEDSTRGAENQVGQTIGQSYTVNPILDFGQDIHFANRSEYSFQKSRDRFTAEDIKIFNDVELMFRDRKTRFRIEYDLAKGNNFMRDDDFGRDTILTAFQHDFRFKWIERWSAKLRTELPINLGWDKTDSLINTMNPASAGYTSIISPGILIDWRIQKKIIREFRIQYLIGGSLYDGTFLQFDTYKKSWDNKLDLSLKAGRNFLLRILLNCSYLFDEEKLKYDLAELKATAMF